MQVHQGIQNLPPFRNAVITIGTFDGVHQGHRQIIDALKQRAMEVGGESVIITFNPHPRKIVSNAPLQLINTLDEKIELLQKTGVDHLVVVPFTKEFSEQSADDYIEYFLIQHFQPHTIIIGYDHRFGNTRKGSLELLAQKASQFGYELIEIPKHVLDEITISSTKIRQALLDSELDKADKLLGYPFFFSGVVIRGDQLGRQLGYPTANLQYTNQDKIRLGYGVYAVYADLEGHRYKGMLSIGNRPTLNDVVERVEVNLFDFSGDIYGKRLKVHVVKYLRGQEKYATLEELKRQIDEDKENSLKFLSAGSEDEVKSQK